MPQFFLASSSNADKTYTVTIDDGAPDHCTCVAFVMARNRARKTDPEANGTCKHIKEVRKSNGAGLPTAAPAPKPTPVTESGMPKLRPMLANSVNQLKLPDLVPKETVVFEQKLDGDRLIVRIEGGKLTAIQRQGKVSQWNDRFRSNKFQATLATLGQDVILDGEWMDGDVLWVFDMPWGGGVNTQTPFSDRRRALEGLFATWKPDPACFRLLPCAKTPEEKALLAIACTKRKAEGVMVKSITGTYDEGKRSSAFLKSKFVKTADLIVTGVGVGKSDDGSDKDNIAASCFRDDKLVEVAHSSTIGKGSFRPRNMPGEKSFDPTQPEYAGDVIELKYLNLGAGDRLVQPTILKLRTDKTADECSFDQLEAQDTTVIEVIG